MRKKSVVVFLAEGFEEIEALTPVDYLRRAGAEVTTVAVGSFSKTVTGAHQISVLADMTFEDYLNFICGEMPDAVVVPGGMPGALNIAKCEKACKMIDVMMDQKRVVAAICASPAVVLSKTNALDGKKWTCYPDMQSQVSDTSLFVDRVPFVVDKNLITARGPGAAEQFSMEIVRLLYGEEAADKIKKASVQR